MQHTRLLFLLVIGLLTLASCSLSKIPQRKVEFQLQSSISKSINENMPGILASVYAPDKNLFWSGAAGFSDKDIKINLKPNQTFRIASVTKTFVSATILRLWEEGKLKLDDPITKYNSEKHIEILKSGGYQPDNMNIRHLLTHTSGLAEHTGSHKFQMEFMKTRHVWTRTEQLNDLVLYASPVGTVGEKFSYSDTGYILLGEIIEKITGTSMGNAITEQLKLKELGLVSTYMEAFDGDFSGNRIHQYFENTDTYNFHPSLDYFGGGGLLSTTPDLATFYISLFQHKVFNQKSTLDTMLTPVKFESEQALDYRMGIWKIEIDGFEAYTHSGFWGTQVVYVPDINCAIAVNYSQRWTSKGIAPIIPELLKIVMLIK